jgi:hypothetical protein
MNLKLFFEIKMNLKLTQIRPAVAEMYHNIYSFHS